MSTSRHFLGFNERTIATLVIAISASVLASLVASSIVVHRFNDSQSRQQAAYRADQDRRQAQFRRQLEAKFQLSLHISTQQANYSINKGVCGWRKVFGPTVNDTRIPEVRRKQIGAFLDNQITVPPDFKCSSLPPKPPK